MAASADLENAWAFTVTARLISPRPRTFTRAPLWVRPLACSTSGSRASRPVASRTSRFSAWYSIRNGLLKPRSFGTRMARGSWPPSKPTGMEPRAAWPLVPRPAVLPPLPPMPRPTRLRRRFEPSAGLRSWIFIVGSSLLLGGGGGAADLFDGHEVRDTSDHAADLGTVGKGVGLADAAQAEGPQRATGLGLGADGRLDLGDLELAHHATSLGTCGPRSDS